MSGDEKEIASFDFHKFGSLTLTEKHLKGVLYSFQRPKQPRQQTGNTIAGNPGEERVEHPIDLTLDRLGRVNVNEGLLMGPVVYLWDAFVVLSAIALFRFLGNCLPDGFSWIKWFALGLAYGIYWGHNWVKTWVNFHFTADGAPYRVLVAKSRMADAEAFVEKVRAERANSFPTAAPMQPEASREKQIKIGIVMMSVGIIVMLLLAIFAGCFGSSSSLGSGLSGSSSAARAPADPCEKYVRSMYTVTAHPELERAVYRKVVKMALEECERQGVSKENIGPAVEAATARIRQVVAEISLMPDWQQKSNLEYLK